MKNKNWISLGIVFIGFIGVTIYANSIKKKIVYVKVGDLYDGFEMKKELESSYMMVQKGRKQQMDSLELELKLINKRIETNGSKDLEQLFDAKKENYLLKKQQFEEDDNQMQEQYTSKIKKQLNQYITDYGKENNYDYVLGAEGSGALMYAKDNDDITKDVLVYVNNKFKGIK